MLDVETLTQRLKLYEQNGSAKLYYALNRKMNEMANLLNKVNLGSLDIGDKNDKTFERLKVMWNDAEGIASAVKTLGEVAGVTGKEEEDIERKPFLDTIATSRT